MKFLSPSRASRGSYLQMPAVSLPVALTEPEIVAIFEASSGAHMALAVRMLGREEDARDALQEAWFRAWKARGALREPAAVHGWLRRILVAECLRLLRRRVVRAWLPFAAEPPCWSPGPEEQVADEEARHALRRAVALLPPQQRVCWGLRFDEGWTAAEIAEVLEVSVDTVKTHLGRAVATVQGRMEARRAV